MVTPKGNDREHKVNNRLANGTTSIESNYSVETISESPNVLPHD